MRRASCFQRTPVSRSGTRKARTRSRSPHRRTTRTWFDWQAKPMKVAVVGYPNVGKSSLVNRLTQTREAVVHGSFVCPINGSLLAQRLKHVPSPGCQTKEERQEFPVGKSFTTWPQNANNAEAARRWTPDLGSNGEPDGGQK